MKKRGRVKGEEEKGKQEGRSEGGRQSVSRVGRTEREEGWDL